jgi:ABC-type phosphate transport system substrate-binding protein
MEISLMPLKNDIYGIGYISLASLESSTLKGLTYEGVTPTQEHVLDGTYELTRNF